MVLHDLEHTPHRRLRHRVLYTVALLLALAGACKSSSPDKGAAQDELVVLTAGESPAPVARASAHQAHGKLRIVVKTGDITQTRTYSVDADGNGLTLRSDGVTQERPGAAPVSAAVAGMSLTLGSQGEVVAAQSLILGLDGKVLGTDTKVDEETANELRALFVALPDTPIGNGARWRFEQQFASSLGPVTQRLDYQVLRRDADELELRLEADAQTKSLGPFTHITGTITTPLGDPWRLPRASLSYSNPQASGTIEITRVD